MLQLRFRVVHPLCRVPSLFSRTISTRKMSPTLWSRNQYPPARRSDHVDVYNSEARGQVRVPDPYQWLERHTDETEEWITAQEKFARTYLDQNLDRQKLEDEIRSNTDYAKVARKT